MSKAEIRSMRICFRTTRAMYWQLREICTDRNVTLSTLVFWMMDHVWAEVLEGDTAFALNTITSHLTDEEKERRLRGVDNTVDVEDLPW